VKDMFVLQVIPMPYFYNFQQAHKITWHIRKLLWW